MTLSAYPLLFRWEGKAEGEKGIEKGTGKVRVEVDPKYYRPTEVVSGGLFQQDLWQPWCVYFSLSRTFCKEMPPKLLRNWDGSPRLPSRWASPPRFHRSQASLALQHFTLPRSWYLFAYSCFAHSHFPYFRPKTFREVHSMKCSRFIVQAVKAVRSLETWLCVALHDNVTHHCVLEKFITAKPQGF